ncbi:hypothetical protein OS493_010409 [Desmophyllum pertusum]|uniref:Protein kinase domain-containing protein n=1 Tax=Desmophyllum pertusum TaxID=174260 RepID=A0A9X0A722_9CNID|nr:hypothetical protein OS493_010409 [Desmophyllum pertusum]
MCGTTLYVALEVYEGKPYDTKVDMYSFGLMMWEMWFGERVFSELRSLIPREFFRRIKDENYRPQTPRSDGRFIPNPPPAQWDRAHDILLAHRTMPETNGKRM